MIFLFTRKSVDEVFEEELPTNIISTYKVRSIGSRTGERGHINAEPFVYKQNQATKK